MAKIILKPQPAKNDVERLSEQLNIDKSLAVLLLQRGFSCVSDCKKFLYGTTQDMCDPFSMQGMAQAVQSIQHFVASKSKISIFGDYDCDGIGATSILYLALKSIGVDVSYFVPERKSDGYGISEAALERLILQQKPNLIISVDCGIGSFKEIANAKEKYGVDFIITDHHELPEVLPNAILINPHFDNGTEFCGAGVAFKLVEALLGRAEALKYVDICAISTVADVVPLVDENRIIVKEGLKKLQNRAIRPGIKELLRISGLEGNAQISAYDIAFKLAPRINASGRLSSAQKSIELFVEDDISTLRLTADALNEDNLMRQKLTETVYLSAKERLKDYDLAKKHIIILEDSAWDAGVLGIAAARLAEQFLRPAILLTERDGIFSGSARSVDGINMYAMLCFASSHLLRFGGHAAAAGMSLKKSELLPLIETCREYLEDKTDIFAHNNRVFVDLEIKEESNLMFFKQFQLLEPYGMGNAKPVFGLNKAIEWRRINTKPHLKAKISAEAEAIAFSKGDQLECWNECVQQYAVSAEINVFQNRTRASLHIKTAEIGKKTFTDETLFVRYLRTNLCHGEAFCGKRREPYKKSGQLLVTFSKNAFIKAKQQYPDHEVFQGAADTLSPTNALVLSPSENANFSYFNEIVFLEAPTAQYLKYILQTCAATVRIEGVAPVFPKIELDILELREIYSAIFNTLNNFSFTSVLEIYQNAFQGKISANRTKFELAFAIFEELGLIFVDKSSMIHINSNKIDLEKSAIYRSLHATA